MAETVANGSQQNQHILLFLSVSFGFCRAEHSRPAHFRCASATWLSTGCTAPMHRNRIKLRRIFAALQHCHGSANARRAISRQLERRERFPPLRISSRVQMSLPIATAVSDIRFEKPHSLSYHVRIRHIVPSITLVWSVWKTEEWGSWLKSWLTSFSSV